MNLRIALLSLLVAAPALHAQPAAAPPASGTANPVVWATNETYMRQARFMLAAAETMPAEKYTYHPTSEQMTFGKIVSHVAQSNGVICGLLSDSKAPATLTVSDTSSKADLIATLKASFEFCNPIVVGLKDAKLADTITYPRGQRVPRASALIELTNDLQDHYSQMAGYMRLNGLLPPSAMPAKKP